MYIRISQYARTEQTEQKEFKEKTQSAISIISSLIYLNCGEMPTECLLHSQLVKRSKARAATQAIGLGKLITCSLLHTARETS